MSGVDVLAVLESAAMWCQSKSAVGSDLGLVDARAAVAELIEAAAEMNRLAKGPAGGVSQADKRAIVNRMEAALAPFGGAE